MTRTFRSCAYGAKNVDGMLAFLSFSSKSRSTIEELDDELKMRANPSLTCSNPPACSRFA